jgi:hypothetical protein
VEEPINPPRQHPIFSRRRLLVIAAASVLFLFGLLFSLRTTPLPDGSVMMIHSAATNGFISLTRPSGRSFGKLLYSISPPSVRQKLPVNTVQLQFPSSNQLTVVIQRSNKEFKTREPIPLRLLLRGPDGAELTYTDLPQQISVIDSTDRYEAYRFGDGNSKVRPGSFMEVWMQSEAGVRQVKSVKLDKLWSKPQSPGS